MSEPCDDYLTLPLLLPSNEVERMKVLREASILDTSSEENYDRYTYMASRLFKVPVAFLSLIDTDRLFFKSRVGFDVNEGPRAGSFCSYAILDDSPPVFIVRNAPKDPQFSHLPAVKMGVVFYAGATIEVEGTKLGTLCLSHGKPVEEDEFGEKEIAMLQDIAGIVANLIRTRREERLSNIYESLVMNADILKLYRVPLQNIGECQNQVKLAFKKAIGCYSLPSYKESVHALLHAVNQLSLQITRLLPLSSHIIQLMIEVYHLEKYEYLTDLPNQRFEGRFIFNSLTEMNLLEIQSNLNEFINLRVPSIKGNCDKNVSKVQIRWAEGFFDSSPVMKMMYSYPTLILILLIILYDWNDFYQTDADIYIQLHPQLRKNEEKAEGLDETVKEGAINEAIDPVQTGCLSITLTLSSKAEGEAEEAQSNNLTTMMLNVFSILESVANCRHYKTFDCLDDTKKISYRMQFPFYLITPSSALSVDVQHESSHQSLHFSPSRPHLSDKMSIRTPKSLRSSKVELKYEAGIDSPIDLEVKSKPSHQDHPDPLTTSLMILPSTFSFKAAQQLWRQFRQTFSSSLTSQTQKVHIEQIVNE